MVAIFVVLMFLGFVLVDRVVQALEARRTVPSKAADVPWNVPQGYYLSAGHTWFHPEPSGGLRVGADALVAYALGVVEGVQLPKLGEQVQAGQPLFQLQCQGHNLEIPSALTGRVAALNPSLGTIPELVTKDPYGSGWICAIAPAQPQGGFGAMRTGGKAVAWLEKEFHRFREFLSLQVTPDLAVGVTYPDGGLPAVGSLTQLDCTSSSTFATEFLRSRP